MAETLVIPSAVERAYATLRENKVCDLIDDPKVSVPGCISFRCSFTLPRGNVSGLPETVVLAAYVWDTFPLSSVDFYPEPESDVQGFPHQDAETRKLCLPAEHLAPINEQRLLTYVMWARDWLLNAANGTLLNHGDPYELPDFSCKLVKSPLALKVSVYTDETPASYQFWQHRIGQTGMAELSASDQPSELFVRRFLTSSHEVIRETAISDRLLGNSPVFPARWLLLPNITIQRHRPAQTVDELSQLCTVHSISLDRALKEAWRGGTKLQQFGILLVGFPIPKVVGGPPSEIHWQPMVLPNRDSTRESTKSMRGKRPEARLWNHIREQGSLAPKNRIYWGRVENVAIDRQVARGGQGPAVRRMPLAIFGCGAIGSLLAEGLVRGGVNDVVLFDPDIVEFGNLCRHTLDGRDVRQSKASALARRLSSAFPTARITAHNIDVPWSKAIRGRFEFDRALDRSRVLIDCTTDQNAFLWLSRYARQSNKRLASLFINPHATILTLLLSGRQTACHKSFRRLMADIRDSVTPANPQEYFANPPPQDQVLPGPGCWHPTFPAQWPHISLLVFAALEHIARWIEEPLACDGAGILMRRNSPTDVGVFLETSFKKSYR